MHPLITKPIDRLIIRLACNAQPKPGRFPPRIDEARALLREPDFFGGPVTVPDLKWSSTHDFQFPSPVASPWPETKTVYGKMYRCGENWADNPTVVLVHGWNDDLGYHFRHRYLAKQLLQAGINSAMVELPYHMQRRPSSPEAVQDFISEDLYCNMLAARQAVADIRSTVAWLDAQGCKRIGLWGVSLGGWLTGLTVSHDDLVRFALLQIPAARMDQVVMTAPFCAPVRHGLKGDTFDFSQLNLRSYLPKVSRDNLLMIEAEHDLFVSKEAIEELWDLWGRPEIWRLPHAHISILVSLSTLKRGVGWISDRVRRLDLNPMGQRR